MGFTALDGLMMGTRCGTIDPGVLLRTVAGSSPQRRHRPDEAALQRNPGLLGVSGLSQDMRALLDSAAPEAATIELFATASRASWARWRRRWAASTRWCSPPASASTPHRCASRSAARPKWLGVALDAAANACHATRIATAASKVDVLVLPTNGLDDRAARGGAGLMNMPLNRRPRESEDPNSPRTRWIPLPRG